MESTSLLKEIKGQSIMSSVKKVNNTSGNRKEEVVTAPFWEKISLTKDVDEGTDVDKGTD